MMMSPSEADFESWSIIEQSIYWYDRMKKPDPDPASVGQFFQWMRRSPEHVGCLLQTWALEETLRQMLKDGTLKLPEDTRH